MSQDPLDAELAAFEAALLPLGPPPSTLDRDRLLFLAGQASARRKRPRAGWLWPCLSAAASLAAVVLGVTLVARPQPPVVERIVYVTQPESPQATQMAERPGTDAPASMPPVQLGKVLEGLRWRQLVATRGLDAIPESKPQRASQDRSWPPIPGRYETIEQFIKG